MQDWMDNDREMLARTLMAEAGNQGPLGMLAAGSVIMNRARTPGYGDGVRGVILKPGQFSPWNSVTGYAGGEQGQNMAAIQPTSEAYAIADRLLSGQYEDPTGGATHFYNPDISNPSWGQAAGGDWTRIGSHIFGRADEGRTGKGGNMQPQGLLSTSGQAEPARLPFFQRPETADFFDRLAIGLGGMTLNPNQALIQASQERLSERRKARETAAQKNRTLDYLRNLNTPQAKEALRYAEGTGDIVGALKMVRPGDTPAAFRSLQAQAEAAGLRPGTPEYQEFMLYGGGRRDSTPASFVALDLQARSAGFVPRAEGGDGRYEEFMATAGKGLSAQAAAEGRARGQAAFDLAGAEVAAARALNLVDLLRNDPALPDMVGPVQGRLPNVSAAAQRFQSRLDQLQGTAFLEAYNMLRGGGQITEVEGQKAERAIARLNVAQNEEDFLTALAEFEDAIRTGLQKLSAQAGGGMAAPAAPAAPAGGADPLGIRGGQ